MAESCLLRLLILVVYFLCSLSSGQFQIVTCDYNRSSILPGQLLFINITGQPCRGGAIRTVRLCFLEADSIPTQIRYRLITNITQLSFPPPYTGFIGTVTLCGSLNSLCCSTASIGDFNSITFFQTIAFAFASIDRREYLINNFQSLQLSVLHRNQTTPSVYNSISSPKTQSVYNSISSPKTQSVYNSISSPKTLSVYNSISSPKTQSVYNSISSPKTLSVYNSISSPKTQSYNLLEVSTPTLRVSSSSQLSVFVAIGVLVFVVVILLGMIILVLMMYMKKKPKQVITQAPPLANDNNEEYSSTVRDGIPTEANAAYMSAMENMYDECGPPTINVDSSCIDRLQASYCSSFSDSSHNYY